MNPKEGERASPSVARIVSNGRKLHAVLVGIRAIAHGPARLKDAIVRVRCAESLGEKRRSYEPKTTTLITPRVGIEKLKIEVTSFASALRAAHPPVRPPAPTMGMFGGLFGAPTFNPTKCKTALRLCLGRVKLLRNKKTNALVNLKRNIADLLNQGKDDSARVRVEAVLREEATLAAFELLDLFCELLIVRLPLIEQSKDLPEDLREAVATVVYCARRMGGEIPELKDVKTQFSGKYGTQYATACSEDTTAEACGVAALAIEKLSLAAPSADIKIEALKTIAEKHGARFDLDALERATKGNEQKKEVQASDEKLSSISNGTEQYADAGQAAAAARAAAMEAAAAAAFAEAEAQRMTDELAALRRVAEEEALVEAARLAEEKRLREAKLIAKAAAGAERLAWEKQEAEEELRAEREAREAAIAEAAQTRAAEKEILEQEELARVLAEAEEEAAWQAERVAAAEAKAEAAALRVEAEALERARWEAEEKRVLFEQEARSKAAAAAKLRAKQEAAEGRARAEAEAAKKKAKEERNALIKKYLLKKKMLE